MAEFKFSSVEHAVNIVTKNLRNSGRRNVNKERLKKLVTELWELGECIEDNGVADNFILYSPLKGLSWRTNTGEIGEGNYFSDIESLITDYRKTVTFLDETTWANDVDFSELLNIPEYDIVVDRRKRVTRPNVMADFYMPGKIAQEFSSLVEYLDGKSGVYFLYDREGDLVYIGKSIDLGSRVVSSATDKKAVAVEIAETQSKTDAGIYESYYISTLHPKENVEGNYKDSVSVVLPDIRNYEKIKIYEEDDYIGELPRRETD